MKLSFSRFISLTLFFIFMIIPFSALADGMIIKYPIEDIGYDYVKESSQRAYINHYDGTQKLIVSVDIEKSDDKKLWIFPVPAHYSDINTDIGTKELDLRGSKITDRAAYFLKDIQDVFLISQLYPLFVSNLLFGSLRSYGPSYGDMIGPTMSGSMKSSSSTEQYDVIVRSEIIKEGMTVQVITAKTAQGVQDHFSERGLDFDPNSLEVLKNYLGQDKYSFIATWINEAEPEGEPKKLPFSQYDYYNNRYGYYGSSNNKTRSVYVDFPAKETYFPMILTSVYEHEIPVDIRVLGLNKIKKGSIYHKLTTTDYYYDQYINTGGDKLLVKFLSRDDRLTDDSSYTLFKVRGKATNFTEDFYSVKGAPLKVAIANLVTNSGLEYVFIIIALALFITLTILSSLVAGHLNFPHQRNKKGRIKLGLLALSNLLTLFGFLIATLISRPDKIKADENISEEVANSVQKIKEEGFDVEIKIKSKKKSLLLYLLSFTLIFCLITILVYLPLILWLKPDMRFGEILLIGAYF